MLPSCGQPVLQDGAGEVYGPRDMIDREGLLFSGAELVEHLASGITDGDTLEQIRRFCRLALP